MTCSIPPGAPPQRDDGPSDAGFVARLTGPRPLLDRRVAAIRDDIVDIALAGCVSASRYVVPVARAGGVPRCAMRALPAADAVAVSELLRGETFEVFEVAGDWCWGRTLHDRYLGWVETRNLIDVSMAPLHRITARRAPVFAAADIKAAVGDMLPFGAYVGGIVQGKFLALNEGGFVHLRHVDAGLPKPPLDVARLFTGAPYVWGGRTPDGVDCSGLVQAALTACGIICPRDSDQQLALLGVAVPFAGRAAGDLVFFPGHVGILATPDRLFHANAFWMTTLEEPLAGVIARLAAAGVAEPVLGVRRIGPPISA